MNQTENPQEQDQNEPGQGRPNSKAAGSKTRQIQSIGRDLSSPPPDLLHPPTPSLAPAGQARPAALAFALPGKGILSLWARGMILGIGTDLCSIERIEATIARFGDRFLTRVYTERERARAESRPRAIAATYAKRWAAKEACSKALGTGLRMGIAWKDMAVVNLYSGQPTMQLTGWAAERLAQMTPEGHRPHIHVTLTDDHPWAQAFVLIEALPADAPPPPAPMPRQPRPGPR